ncbi:acyl- thioesterase [Cystoisospora suis]|uniref:Acyl-thioesterase n=1 Tax=Cystoisospora suis TaxID=483139 RepID=A0A2C6KED1_9APIC|nr:acyl- thioesterase [Cystoisospora suis]
MRLQLLRSCLRFSRPRTRVEQPFLRIPAGELWHLQRRVFCSSQAASSVVVPSVSSLAAKTEVPVGNTCLMTKWVLEKIGANPDSLSCFVPENVQPSADRNSRNFFEGWLEVRIGFESRSSKALRDAFRRAYDNRLLRWGRLLEVLDCFAGDIAYHYCTPDEEGYSKLTTLMVTASIERMEFRDSPAAPGGDFATHSEVITGLSVNEDLTLIGYVTQSGSSSVGIRIEMQQGNDVKGSVFFVMVAVNEEGKPVKTVPKLDISSCSPELRSLISNSVVDFQARKENAKKTFSLVPPDPEESRFLHETWKHSLMEGRKVVWMQDTRLESTELIQPEALSRYNRAFGGLVSRKALELSYLTSQCFLKAVTPVLKGVDDIYFLEPLFVGEMVMMRSTVVWVTAAEIQVQVEAFRVDPVSGEKKKTNIFNFRYGTRVHDEDLPRQEKPPPVFPQNYADCIAFIEARRRDMLRERRNP